MSADVHEVVKKKQSGPILLALVLVGVPCATALLLPHGPVGPDAPLWQHLLLGGLALALALLGAWAWRGEPLAATADEARSGAVLLAIVALAALLRLAALDALSPRIVAAAWATDDRLWLLDARGGLTELVLHE